MLFQLFEMGILTRKDVFSPKELEVMDSKYEHIHTIRPNAKKVTYTDTETGEVVTYDSINKAAKARRHGNGFYLVRNRQDGKYLSLNKLIG